MGAATKVRKGIQTRSNRRRTAPQCATIYFITIITSHHTAAVGSIIINITVVVVSTHHVAHQNRKGISFHLKPGHLVTWPTWPLTEMTKRWKMDCPTEPVPMEGWMTYPNENSDATEQPSPATNWRSWKNRMKLFQHFCALHATGSIFYSHGLIFFSSFAVGLPEPTILMYSQGEFPLTSENLLR